MKKNSKIYVAGHDGLVGSAIMRKLEREGYTNIITKTFLELDLTRQKDVEDFFDKEKPEFVLLAAAKVGGILANKTYKAEFIYDNMMIQFNVIHSAYINKVKKLLFLGSSCIYPKNCPQPMKEEYLLTSSLEPTNESYALAKISGLKMCDYYREQYGCNFISAMPTNLYGPNDNFNLETSHVLPAIIRKIHLAKCFEENDFVAIKNDLIKNPYTTKNVMELTEERDLVDLLYSFGIFKEIVNGYPVVKIKLWGSGSPFREFLHSNDLADALLFLMDNYSDYGQVNIGTGKDLRINELAEMIKEIIGYTGGFLWNKALPDGTPKKQLDVSKLNSLGWVEEVDLKDGLKTIYKDYVK